MVFDPERDFEEVVDGLSEVEIQDENGVRLKAGVRSSKKQLSLGDINALKIRNVSRTDCKFRIPRTDYDPEPAVRQRVVEDDGTIWEVVASYSRVGGTQWEVVARPLGTVDPLGTRILALALTTANTEYSLNLGTVKSIGVRCRGNAANVRLALESGKVAGAVDPYHTVHAGASFTLSIDPPAVTTLYAAAEQNGVVAEITARRVSPLNFWPRGLLRLLGHVDGIRREQVAIAGIRKSDNQQFLLQVIRLLLGEKVVSQRAGSIGQRGEQQHLFRCQRGLKRKPLEDLLGLARLRPEHAVAVQGLADADHVVGDPLFSRFAVLQFRRELQFDLAIALRQHPRVQHALGLNIAMTAYATIVARQQRQFRISVGGENLPAPSGVKLHFLSADDRRLFQAGGRFGNAGRLLRSLE